VLAIQLGVVLWGTPPAGLLVTWLSTVIVIVSVQWLGRRRLRRVPDEAVRARRFMRASNGVLGLAWGLGALLITPFLSPYETAVVAVVFGALAAGSAIRLIGDPLSFYLLVFPMMGALPLVLVTVGPSPAHIMLAGLVALALMVLVVPFRASVANHREYVRAARELAEQREATIREKEFLDLVLTGAPSAIAVLDDLGRITRVNSAFYALFGFTQDEAIGRDINTLIVPATQRQAATHLERRTRAGDQVRVETVRCRKDGCVIPVLISAATVKSSADGVCVVYEDLTTIKATERELRETREQYRQLVESASDLVWRVDRDLRWEFVNEAAAHLYGYPRQKLLGEDLLARTHPSRREQDAQAFRAVLSGAELRDHRTVHVTDSGAARDVSMTVRPVWADGEVIGAQGITRDVTAQVRVLHDLDDARNAAERMAAAKGAFLANMSHELRTPMNGILGMIDLLLDSGLDTDQRRAADLVRTSARSLLSIINDILDLSRIEAGGLTLEDVGFDLPSLVDSVVRVLAMDAEKRDVDVAYHVQSDVPSHVRGDPGRLRQILTNLVGNAVKFTREGEIVVTVSLDGRSVGDAQLRIDVRDTGIGIPADRLVSVFEEYAQSDSATSREFGGTGLGLAITRRLVHLMSGTITVESAVGYGSTFSVRIGMAVDGPQEHGVRRSVDLTGIGAVVVGERLATRGIVASILTDAGVRVIEAETAEATVGCLRRAADVQVAVIDSALPTRQAFDLARRIRRDPQLSHVRIMLLTSAGQRGDAQLCREAGVAAYLTKPVSRAELLEALAALLSESQSRGIDPLVTRHSIEESRHRLRVLVVEDNAVSRTAVTAMLRRRGHRVEAVETVHGAIDALNTDGYDVALVDMRLPDGDGTEVLDAARRRPVPMPVVATTASTEDGVRERCLGAGFVDLLWKPFEPHELFAVVEGWGIAPAAEPNARISGPHEAPVDLEGFAAVMTEAGVSEATWSLLSIFHQDAPKRFGHLEAAVGRADARDIELTAHAFKSAAGTVRAMRLVTALDRVEREARHGDVTAARSAFEGLRGEYEAVLRYLTKQEAA
jgi:PAS domain S-box-containing protein